MIAYLFLALGTGASQIVLPDKQAWQMPVIGLFFLLGGVLIAVAARLIPKPRDNKSGRFTQSNAMEPGRKHWTRLDWVAEVQKVVFTVCSVVHIVGGLFILLMFLLLK